MDSQQASPDAESSLLLRVFTHPACGGCTGTVQEAWRVSQDHPDVELRTVSLTNEAGLAEARSESIQTIPTLILSAGSAELRRWVGTPEPGSVRAALESALASA